MSWVNSLAFSQADCFFQVGGGAHEFLVVYQDVVVRVFLFPFPPVGLDGIRVLFEVSELSGNGVKVCFVACWFRRGGRRFFSFVG
jgi:hypothetical protein